MSHSPACGSLQDLFSDWIGSFPGSGTPQYAGRALTEEDPGCGSFHDLAVSRMWYFPGGDIFQDLTFPRMWDPSGRNHPQDMFCPRMWHSPAFAPRRQKKSVAVGAKSWCPGCKFRMGAKGPECAHAARQLCVFKFATSGLDRSSYRPGGNWRILFRRFSVRMFRPVNLQRRCFDLDSDARNTK